MGQIPKLALMGLDLAFILVGAACLGGAVLAQGGRFNMWLDLFSHFAPIWLCGGTAVALYGFFIWGRPWLGLAAMIASFALMAPEYLRTLEPNAPANRADAIKIIQYNAWRKNGDTRADVQWLVKQGADIIAIEELTPEFREQLVALGGYQFTKGRLGSGLFTKTAPVDSPLAITRPWRDWPDLASASLPSPRGSISMIAVHMTWPTYRGQAFHRERLIEALSGVDRSHAILVGDFNLTPWSFALQDFDRRIGLTRRDRAIFSWPGQPFWRGRLKTPLPFLPIDHVYAGSAWRTVSIQRGPRLGSDHYPLIVVLAASPAS